MKAYRTSMVLLCTAYITAVHANDQVVTDDIHRYMWAEYQRFGGNGKEAYLWYRDLLSTDPSPHAHIGYIHFLSQTGNLTSIIPLYDKYKDHFKKDSAIQLIFVQALEGVGRSKEAEDLLYSLAKEFKKSSKITLYAAQTYLSKKELEKALTVIDNYLNSAPKTQNNYIFYFLKSQVYNQQDDLQNALKYVKKSLKIYPNFDKGWLMYAALKEQAGHLQEAINGYTTFLRKTSYPNFDIQNYLMNLIFKQKALEQKANTLLTDKTCLDQALILFKNKQYEHALEKVDACIQDNPKQSEGKILKVQMYTSMHDYTQAANTIESYALDDPDNDIWHQALHLLCRSGLSYKKAIKRLYTIEKKHPHSLSVHLYLADLLTRDKQLDRAIEQHNKAIKATSDATLQMRLYYNMAIVQYQQKNFPLMLTALNEVQKRDATFLPALNLHAYYCATSGKQLKKAKKLIATVLKKEPYNPHYLDTHALILYKEKKYDQAHALLQKLAKVEPNDPTIIKHLAKVQFKLGNKKQACIELNKATQYAHAHEKKECESLLKRWNL